jgi:uncharacterized membrane protein
MPAAESGPQRAIQEWLAARPTLPAGQGRIEAIDLARGIAIALMIVSHTVSGLLGIGLLLVLATAVWIVLTRWVKARA